MKTDFLRALPAIALALCTLPALAQDATPQVNGEIRKVDTETGRLTIRHQQIPNLDMPPMTMVFKAAPALLQQAHAGQKIRFTAERVDGALTVTSLAVQADAP
ncbi:copper-binding protein [Herbaspirillum sp. YR522]|uniref:copper-binding protein n=1 Tax=Herbaspirillum sp. YR522 TaxID=1144342 RepID=UPI00026FAB63|nr:copper-binding protein [Herbaspirillum sp. YR522]EJM97912.1 hypothetical protein PMI40_04187 [Herbaspirillum sp. YR522]